MPGSDAAQRLCRRHSSQRDEFHLRSRLLPDEANFPGRVFQMAVLFRDATTDADKSGEARQQPRPTGQAVRQYSLMFAYVRICSDMFA